MERLIERVERLEKTIADKDRVEKLEKTLFPESQSELTWRDVVRVVEYQSKMKAENSKIKWTAIISVLVALFSNLLHIFLSE